MGSASEFRRIGNGHLPDEYSVPGDPLESGLTIAGPGQPDAA